MPLRPSTSTASVAAPCHCRATARLTRRAGALALGGVLLLAGPAAAHPFIRGGEVPVDSLATITLAMAHGCGDESTEGGEPTTDVSLEVPEWMRVVDVPDEDGWVAELETDDDGAVSVVTWVADDAQEPAPDFDLDVVVTGEVGEQRTLRVFQACDDDIYRWVGTPEEPADDPAVNLTLAAADPDAPPPPEPEPGSDNVGGGTSDGTDDASDAPDPDATDDSDAEADAPDAADPTDDADAATDGDSAADGGVSTDDAASDAAAEEDADGGLPGWFAPLTAVVLLGGIAGLFMARRGRREPWDDA